MAWFGNGAVKREELERYLMGEVTARDQYNQFRNTKEYFLYSKEIPQVFTADSIPPSPLGYKGPEYHWQNFQAWELTPKVSETVGFSGHDMNPIILPYSSKKIRNSLPSWLKLFMVNVEGRPVYTLNPSSGFLEDTTFCRGRFLFRGENRASPEEDAAFLVQEIKRGIYPRGNRGVVYTTPDLKGASVYTRPGSSPTNWWGASREDSCHIWVIGREIMDEQMIGVYQDNQLEVWLSKIPPKYLRACITTLEISKRVEQMTEIPHGGLIPSKTMSTEEIQQLVKELETKGTVTFEPSPT